MPESEVNTIEKKLTRQDIFVQEYLIDLNGKQAAIRAGYSPATAEQQASRLLRNVKVRGRIEQAMAERSRRTGVNADRVIQELARLAFVDPTNVIDFQTGKVQEEISAEDRAVLAGVKIKDTTGGMEREVKLTDKLRALELLGKHLGLFDRGTDDSALEKLDRILEGIDHGTKQ